MDRDLSALIRADGISEVGPSAFAVYLVLRDQIWRSAKKGPGELRRVWSDGKLAASLSNEQLCARTGLSRNTVRAALARLVEAKWIYALTILGDGIWGKGRRVYVLGEVDGGAERFAAGGVKKGTPGDPKTGPTVGQKLNSGGSKTDQVPGQNLTPIELLKEPQTEPQKNPQPEGGARSIRKIRQTRSRAGSKIEGTPQPPAGRAGWVDLADRDAKPTNGRASPVADPAHGERALHPEELRHLQSARAKSREDRQDEYTGMEMVAAWKAHYWVAFGIEDPDLAMLSAQRKVARTLTTRARQWEGGSRLRILRYLKTTVRWWRERKEKQELGTVPTLVKLLERKASGEVSWAYKRWKSGGMKRGGKR